jgi:hypothetical protein
VYRRLIIVAVASVLLLLSSFMLGRYSAPGSSGAQKSSNALPTVLD